MPRLDPPIGRGPTSRTSQSAAGARTRESAYASLHGWNGETCEGCAPVEPDIQIFSEPPPAYEAADEPLPASGPAVREPITEGKDVVGDDEHDPAEGEGD